MMAMTTKSSISVKPIATGRFREKRFALVIMGETCP
jgi:hypothetical protein